MNDLERLLAEMHRPQPSHELDQRVEELLSQQPTSPSHARWKSALVFSAVAACAGLIGFVGGRQSAAVPRTTVAATITAPHRPTEPQTTPANVVRIPLQREQLAGLFVQTAAPEHMLGRGQVNVEVSTSP